MESECPKNSLYALSASLVFLACSCIVSNKPGALENQEAPAGLQQQAEAPLNASPNVIEMPTLAWVALDSNYLSLHVRLVGKYGNSLWLIYGDNIPDGGIPPSIQIVQGATTGYQESEEEFSSSLSIFDFDSLGTKDLFVMGNPVRRGGAIDYSKVVMQYWKLTYPDGWPVASTIVSSVPWGSPTAESQWSFDVVGGTYKSPGMRDPVRREVQEILELSGDVTCFEVDPDGRYLVYAEAGLGLWQVDLLATGPLVPVLTLPSSQYPSLGSVANLKIRRSSSGQKTLIVTAEGSLLVYCPDADNNGFFDSVAAMDGMSAVQTGLTDPDTWATSYEEISF